MDLDSDDFSNYFSKRAEIMPQLSSEDFENTSKFLKQIQEERAKFSSTENTKSRRKKQATSKNLEQILEEGTKGSSLENIKCHPKKRGIKKVPDVDDVEKPKEITIEDNSECLALPLSLTAKRRRNALQKKIDSGDNSECPVPQLSRSAKRRQNALQKRKMSVDTENQKIFSLLKAPSNNVIVNEVIDVCEKESNLTISYLNQILRVKYNEVETFSTIFPRIADLLKLNVSEFLLCFKDKNIKVGDSPTSLNIVTTDILECIPYKAQENEVNKYDEDKLLLLFQASDMKEKTEIHVHKLEKMQCIIERYSKTRNIPLNQMVFEFDGERILGTETPQDLDMESGNCVDVRVLNAEDKLSRKGSKGRNQPSVVDLTEIEENRNASDPDIIFCY